MGVGTAISSVSMYSESRTKNSSIKERMERFPLCFGHQTHDHELRCLGHYFNDPLRALVENISALVLAPTIEQALE